MSIEWFRWYHGTVSDPKFGAISRKTKQPKSAVIATWAAVLEYTSQANERGDDRGSLDGLDHETIAACLDMDDNDVAAIISGMTDKGLIDGQRVLAWDQRQVRREREDDSAERVRRYRERKAKEAKEMPGNADVTPGNATVTPPETETDTETEKESTAEAVVVDAVAPTHSTSPALHLVKPPCPYAAIVDLYHEILPELPTVKVLTDQRKGLIKQRWNNKPGPNLEKWRAYFEYVRTCPWLMGEVPGNQGRPPFHADLEWLTRPNNHAKTVEGKYESKKESAHG